MSPFQTSVTFPTSGCHLSNVCHFSDVVTFPTSASHFPSSTNAPPRDEGRRGRDQRSENQSREDLYLRHARP